MKRSAPPKRKTPVKRRRSKPRRSERVSDPVFMAWVRELPCLLRYTGQCRGRIEADHAGKRPLGRKADDTTCIPLCGRHHRERTDYRGAFATMDAETMRVWCDVAIHMTRRDYYRWLRRLTA